MRRHTLHLSVKQLDRLKALSEETGLSVAELVRRAVDVFAPADVRSGPADRREAACASSQ